MKLKIIPVENIPLGEEVPLNDLFKIYIICQNLESICKQEKGIGISAVQVGIPWNLFLIKSETRFEYLINCDYTPISDDKIIILEGCLSIRSNNKLRYFNVPRFSKVLVTGKKLVFKNNDLFLEDFKSEVSDLKSIVMQHEIDHQKKILISDIGTEIEIYKVQNAK